MQPFQIYRVKGPPAFSELMALYGVDRPGLKESFYVERVSGRRHLRAHPEQGCFPFHPYDSFTPVLDFIRRSSARTPGVIAIKQTLYRVGNAAHREIPYRSPALRKQVTAVVELKARFDEERNITWAEEMEKAGVNVVYVARRHEDTRQALPRGPARTGGGFPATCTSAPETTTPPPPRCTPTWG